jgi:hypothetical protein
VFESPWNHCERTGCLGYRETLSVALDSYFSFDKYQILPRAQYLATAEQSRSRGRPQERCFVFYRDYILLPGNYGRSSSATCMVGNGHQHSGMRKPVLLLESGRNVDCRLTPTLSIRDESNPERSDEGRPTKDLLHQISIDVCHGYDASRSVFLMSNASIICNNLVLRGLAISPVKRNPADRYIEIRRLLDAMHTIRRFQARTMPAVVVVCF